MDAEKTKKEFTTTQEEFGKPIKFDTSQQEKKDSKGKKKNKMGANAMISQFINVKKNYHDRLREMAQSDRHARRYFCADDCAFIFDYKVMKALVQVIEDKYKDIPDPKIEGGIFLFQGLKKGARKPKSNQKEEPPAFGRPTIIATAYHKVDKDNYQHIPFGTAIIKKWFPTEYSDKFVEDSYDGFQHPGDGNSGSGEGDDPLSFAVNDKPKVVDAGGEEDDTDYVIKTKINVADLKGWFLEK